MTDPDGPELRDAANRLRDTMDEAADGFDLNEHARRIAAEVVAARRRTRIGSAEEGHRHAADATLAASDFRARQTSERMEEERWRRRSQKHTGS